MVNADAIRNIIGIIGNVISFGLFISPAPTFYRIIKNKDVEEFQPYPYVATVLNCLLWIFYGLPFVTPNSILVVTTNSIGLVIEAVYLTVYLYYDKQNKERKKVAYLLVAEFIFMAIIVTITMSAIHTHKIRTLFVGIFSDVFNFIMYASPLAIMQKVIKTKSVEYMPIWLSVANTANGCIWAGYAFFKMEIFLLIPNGLGAIAGFLQLILYACYYKSTPKRSGNADVVKASEIQLSHGGQRV